MPVKPAPTAIGQPFPRIPVDEAEGSDFAWLLHTAVIAVGDWTFGPHGPYENPRMTGAERTRGEVREGLLHLLELGLIDIDTERLHLLMRMGMPLSRRPEAS